MDHSLPVRFVQGVRNLDAVAQHLIDRRRAFLEPIGQRLASQVLHDQKVGSFVVPTSWSTQMWG
jgi:hypothetical protein